MAISFREVHFPPLAGFTASAPDGAVIGIRGDDGAGKSALLRLAAGLGAPERGEVAVRGSVKLLGSAEDPVFPDVDILLIDQTLALRDDLSHARASAAIECLRRRGATVLIVSHEDEWLRSLCDEIWWIDAGRLVVKGDPSEVIRAYRRHVAQRLRSWGEGASSPLQPSMRRGDGRAEVLSVETLDRGGRPTMVWTSGERAAVRVSVRFHRPVDDPVVGIMIRTRIGFEVYGTNTELEQVKLGRCAAGDTRRVLFSFRCDLCPQEYTLTAASHDPDGVWHDWLEDAVAFSVTDSRYTAGVANLRSKVEFG